MALKLMYKDPAEIPEDFKDLYEEKEGVWHLKLEDKVAPKDKLDEFRQNNVKLMKQLKEYEDKLKGVDPDEYKALKKKMKELEEKKLLEAGKVEELVQRKAMEIKQSYEDKLKELQKETQTVKKTAETYRDKLARTVIDSEVQRAVLSVAKPRKGAINDILLRAKTTWKITEDGTPLPFNDKGEIIQKDEGPLTFRDWAESLVEEAPYLFEGSGGGGGRGGNGGGGGPKTISKDDKEAFNAHLEDIAKGKIKVVA